MENCDIKERKERLKKLRSLRDRLCQKNKNWKDGFEARDWIVKEIRYIRQLVSEPNIDTDIIKKKIDDLLDVLDPGEIT